MEAPTEVIENQPRDNLLRENQPGFVHLRCHSEYSILDGIVRIDDYVAAAKGDAMPALALTDLNNLFGAVKFYKAARGKGIKPILGCDVWLENAAKREQPYRALLLVQNDVGYRLLSELLTRAFLENQNLGRAEIRPEWLQGNSQGLLMLIGGANSEFQYALSQDNLALAEKSAAYWSGVFPNRLYIEVQRAAPPQAQSRQERHIAMALQVASRLVLPVVATQPVQFITPDDFKAHEARVCIAEGYMLADSRRPRNFSEEQYFKTQAQMEALFADMPEALQNSVEIARRCNLTLTLGKNYLPDFPTPDGLGLNDYLIAQSQAGLVERLVELYPDQAARAEKNAGIRKAFGL